MAGAGGLWRIRVSGSLVYRKPPVGLWSLKIDVDPAAGDTFTVILDPDHQGSTDSRGEAPGGDPASPRSRSAETSASES